MSPPAAATAPAEGAAARLQHEDRAEAEERAMAVQQPQQRVANSDAFTFFCKFVTQALANDGQHFQLGFLIHRFAFRVHALRLLV